MIGVILKACSFAFIILVGIGLRSADFFGEEAGATVKKILIFITLPCAIITNFSSLNHVGGEMVIIAAFGIVINIMMMIVGMLLTRRKEKGEQALFMLCLPAVNIGAFCLPFIQNFLPSLGSVTACMFDVGNSIMCTGGTYAFVAEYTAENKTKMDLKSFGKRLVTSPPLVTYVLMFLVSIAGLQLPTQVIQFIEPIAKANTFVAMFMLGLLFHLELKKEYLGDIAKILIVRHVFAIVMAVFVYYVLPFDLIIRQTLVLCLFGPISAVAPAYTGMCGGDEGKASCANSISIICSLLIMTILLALMGLH